MRRNDRLGRASRKRARRGGIRDVMGGGTGGNDLRERMSSRREIGGRSRLGSVLDDEAGGSRLRDVMRGGSGGNRLRALMNDDDEV